MGLLLLVRHGQASWDAEDYDVLSPLGWEQARSLGRAWAERGVRPGHVVRGSLRRHRETTEGLLEGAGLDLETHEDAGWDEFDHLDVLAGWPAAGPGGSRAESPTDKLGHQRWLEEAIEAWRGDEGSYQETFGAFTARIGEALRRTQAQSPREGATVVVTSGGAIAWVVASLLCAADEAEQDPAVLGRVWRRLNVVCANSSVTKVVVGRRGTTLVSFNDHAHLEPTPTLLTYR